MEKRTKTETKTYVTEEWVAVDGQVFRTAAECDSHEKCLINDEKWNKIKAMSYTPANGYFPFDGGEYYESHSYKWIYIKTDEELGYVTDLVGYNKYEGYDLPEWFCLEFYDEDNPRDSSYITPLPMSIDYSKKLLDILGYDVTITKREDEQNG